MSSFCQTVDGTYYTNRRFKGWRRFQGSGGQLLARQADRGSPELTPGHVRVGRQPPMTTVVPVNHAPNRRFSSVLALALCAFALSGCFEEAAEVRDGVDQAQQTARDAQRLRDAVRDFDRVAAERKVREVVKQPVSDVSCPLEPRINWDLLAVEVRCTAVLGSGDELAVPVRYTPGAGFSAGQPRQVG